MVLKDHFLFVRCVVVAYVKRLNIPSGVVGACRLDLAYEHFKVLLVCVFVIYVHINVHIQVAFILVLMAFIMSVCDFLDTFIHILVTFTMLLAPRFRKIKECF
jgi:hypothetical protein